MEKRKSGLRGALGMVGLGALFALSHNKGILYKSNETTKLLHGIAGSGGGYLGKDWFVNTVDPLPIFSRFVSFTYRTLGESGFYLYYALLLGVFCAAAVELFAPRAPDGGVPAGAERARRPLFLAFLFLYFSHVIGSGLEAVLGFDPAKILQNGVAEQYLLGSLFQNSLFGVFLVLSIPLFLRGRRIWASLSIALACTIHSAYLFGGAALTIAFLLVLLREKGGLRKAAVFGSMTLALVLPIVFYNRGIFASASPEEARRALEILVVERIPHHSLPAVWFDAEAVVKILVVAAAVFVEWKRPLGLVLAVPFAFGVAGALAQVATGSYALALLAPWRVSVFLVPLSILALARAGIDALLAGQPAFFRERSRAVHAACALVVAACAAGGALSQVGRFAEAARNPERTLFSFVAESKGPTDLYLVPPRATALEEFRIRAGAPIVVNWKSHPYGSLEVLEWYDRNQRAGRFYSAPDVASAATALGDLVARYGVTQVLVATEGGGSGGPPERALEAAGASREYGAGGYALYRLP